MVRTRTRNTRRRRFMWTMNNPSQQDKHRLVQLVGTNLANFHDIRYIVFQEEKGHENGTIHIQGYCELLKAKRINGITLMFGRSVHVSRVDHPAAAIKYCKKDDTKVLDGLNGEWGTPARSKVFSGSLLESIQEGATRKEIMENFPNKYMKSGNNIDKMINEFITRRDWEMEIEIYYGITGCGKSLTAHQKYPDAFWVKWPCGSRWWWDGYNGEKVVIFDEFRHQIKFDVMLHILDCYPYKIEYKGGMREFTSKKIVITTNIEPMNWYPKLTDVSMLHRRFKDYTKIYDFDEWLERPNGEKVTRDIHYLERATPIARDVFSFSNV